MNKFGTRLRADETPKNAQGSVSLSPFFPKALRLGVCSRGYAGPAGRRVRGRFAGTRLPGALCSHAASRPRAAPLSLHRGLGADPGLT